MPALLHFAESVTFGSFVVKCFQPSSKYQVSYVFLSVVLVHVVMFKFLMEQVMGHFRLLFLVVAFWMEAFRIPTILNMLEYILCQCLIIKNLIGEASVDRVKRGLSLLHLTLWLVRDMV